MKIVVTSVFVSDQAAALRFYTEILGFQKKTEVDAGEYKWLTVVSPEDPSGPELLLEPNVNPVAKDYQAGLVAQGLPAKVFAVRDIQAEYQRLKEMGVKFVQEPTNLGPVTVAVLDDTCGNLIQIAQYH